MTQPAQITIDIVSDVACPWCAVGYKGLERALDALGDRVDAKISWHPFELSPGTPPEGQKLSDYVRERYGASPEQSAKNRSRIVDAGAALGIDFRYSDESRIYNTFKAHQLLHWASTIEVPATQGVDGKSCEGQESGKQTELKLAFFKAYFTDQANVSEEDVLLSAVESVGLDRAEAAAVLADGRYAGTVRAEENFWQEQNITGVPAFIVNGKFMIPGAQDAPTFVRVLERVMERETA